MNFEWHDVVGGIGVAILLITYLVLQLNLISAKSLNYSILNGIGSALLVISLTQDFNKSAFVIESCWFVISVVGAIVSLREKRRS